MRMGQRQFRIGELADHLKVERFVVRFWEKEFAIKSYRSSGGQRFYESRDIQTFENIKDLLYSQGFTISGAKKVLSKPSVNTIIPSQKIDYSKEEAKYQNIEKKFIALKKELIKLRENL